MNKKECCGCTACMHICPVKCISMQEDEEGFLYPVTDEERCIHCNKCEKVCPFHNTTNMNTQTDAFVGYNKNEEIRKQSSSGGVFWTVGEWILQQNGVVFGAAFNEDFEVCHIAAETQEDMAKLRGSKYVQSRLGNAYPKVKDYLNKNRKVLFTGTACQIEGLKRYLNKEYDNLYTVEVLCHGVPSPKIWRMYLEDKKKQYNASIKNIEFRNKKNGWKKFSVNIEFTDMQQYLINIHKDKFMKMFLENIDLRPSCHNCRFKDFPRTSDMTIGDCWGIKNYMSDMDDDKGISVILVHSSKGKQMLEMIEENLIVKEAILDKALPKIDGGRRAVEKHPNRKKFFKGLKRGENIDELYGYVQKNLIQRAICYLRYFVLSR